MTLTQSPRRWNEVSNDVSTNGFSEFTSIIGELYIEPFEAALFFGIDYENAITLYSDDAIQNIFYMVYKTNKKKYEMMVEAYKAEYDPIENYFMSESSTDTRTPDLTVSETQTLNTTVKNTGTQSDSISSTVKNSGTQSDSISSTVKNTGTQTTDLDNTQSKLYNQSKTVTENPNGHTTTTTHTVNPYDGTGMRDEYVDASVQTGSTQTVESYSGLADTITDDGKNTRTDDLTQTTTGTNSRTDDLTQTTTGTNTRTDDLTQTTTGTNASSTATTGTDTNTHTLTRRGNIGVTTSQKMLEAELALSEKMNIFRVIERDIAQKLFLQVW